MRVYPRPISGRNEIFWTSRGNALGWRLGEARLGRVFGPGMRCRACGAARGLPSRFARRRQEALVPLEHDPPAAADLEHVGVVDHAIAVVVEPRFVSRV